MKNSIVALLGVAGLATAAFGQAGWNIAVSNQVTPTTPSATVTVSAFFSAQDHAFAAALFALVAAEAGWSGNTVLLPPPNNPGVINGGSIDGITAGQIHFPPVVNANPANPIAVFEATWSTGDFTPRSVDVNTRTTRFDAYISATSPASQSRLAGLLEGAGAIEVVPAPSALALLGMGALVAGRRRR